ncbi:uncharacterized protein LOC142559636 [Dermacentor variabilis]|uniref:uncharacterized protein LOC142559636 n=1 Tax=Dermacentor variabilis TaxID=34621 RepID=UPI003F5C8B13
MISLTNTDYTFDQYYKDGQQQQQGPRRLYGKLSSGGEGPVMTVSQQQGAGGIPYTLKYWSGTEQCAILTLTKEGNHHCEQHVWNSQISSAIGNCDAAYKENCPSSTTHQVYDSSC